MAQNDTMESNTEEVLKKENNLGVEPQQCRKLAKNERGCCKEGKGDLLIVRRDKNEDRGISAISGVSAVR